MSHPILQFFSKPDVIDLAGLRAYLDGLDHAGRLDAIAQLGGREQSRLFEAAQGFKPLTLDDFVPPGTGELVEVIHYGRNTLPAFNNFQKRFTKPAGKTDELWGYNEQSMKWAVGPGYFITRQSDPQEVVIDYREVPPGKIESWPGIKPNSAGLSRLVYDHMQDYMRGVSNHVSIGRASKKGKTMDAWFVLCRDR
jgi:hypothetical protein